MTYRTKPGSVEAWQILAVLGDPAAGDGVDLVLDGAENVRCMAANWGQAVPVRGDYWIEFSPTDKYVCPREVFERKYSPAAGEIEQPISDEAARASARRQVLRTAERVGLLPGEISDGFHTFNELYDHRITLFIALCRQGDVRADYGVWRSELHSDGSKFDGWFILGLGRNAGEQITYHLPLSRWSECDFAETLDRAPEFDGHTSADVLERLKTL